MYVMNSEYMCMSFLITFPVAAKTQTSKPNVAIRSATLSFFMYTIRHCEMDSETIETNINCPIIELFSRQNIQ